MSKREEIHYAYRPSESGSELKWVAWHGDSDPAPHHAALSGQAIEDPTQCVVRTASSEADIRRVLQSASQGAKVVRQSAVRYEKKMEKNNATQKMERNGTYVRFLRERGMRGDIENLKCCLNLIQIGNDFTDECKRSVQAVGDHIGNVIRKFEEHEAQVQPDVEGKIPEDRHKDFFNRELDAAKEIHDQVEHCVLMQTKADELADLLQEGNKPMALECLAFVRARMESLHSRLAKWNEIYSQEKNQRVRILGRKGGKGGKGRKGRNSDKGENR